MSEPPSALAAGKVDAYPFSVETVVRSSRRAYGSRSSLPTSTRYSTFGYVCRTLSITLPIDETTAFAFVGSAGHPFHAV